MKSAFVDSGAFIALLDAGDRSHDEVDAMFAALAVNPVTSVLVVSETYGWFLHRHGESGARAFRALLRELPRLTIVGADPAHLAAAGRKLDALRGHRLSMVDASSLVILEHRRIGLVWGTDSDLALEGASVQPGPPRR